MILMFVRHAEAVSDEITEFGKRQIELAVQEEINHKFAKIYTSPANRCVETASAFCEKLNLGIEVVDGFAERELLKTKYPKNKKEQEWYDNYLNPIYSSKSPEGCKEYLARNFREFKKIINKHFEKNENAIMVAHSCTFYALMAFLNGVYKNKNIKWYRITTCGRVYFEINERV